VLFALNVSLNCYGCEVGEAVRWSRCDRHVHRRPKVWPWTSTVPRYRGDPVFHADQFGHRDDPACWSRPPRDHPPCRRRDSGPPITGRHHTGWSSARRQSGITGWRVQRPAGSASSPVV